jgi:hypothetical protein
VADTGLPWELPYPLPTDLVRDGADAIKDLAEATATGLDDLDTAIQGAGGLVAVKHALFTGTQAVSVGAGGNVAVTNLSITHALASASNKLIISAYFGQASNSEGRGQVGLGVMDGSTFIAIGGAAGSRVRVGAGGRVSVNDSTAVVSMPSVTFVYEPGSTSSRTYTVRAINIRNETRTIAINRSVEDPDSRFGARSASALVIQEIKV